MEDRQIVMADFTVRADRVTVENVLRGINVEVEGVDTKELLDQIGKEECMAYFGLEEPSS